MSHETIPALRPVEVIAITHEGHDFYLLRDPQGIAEEPLLLAAASTPLLRFFDGRHMVSDVCAAVLEATGQIVPADQILQFVTKLDKHLFLETPAFEARRLAVATQYAALAERPPRFAGNAYQEEAERLLEQLDASYTGPGGPGLPGRPAPHPPAAIVAPHIDPARGGDAYAQAYAALWGTRPKRIVILGINHAESRQPFSLTTKDYRTPLGMMPTDGAFVTRLAARLDWDPCAEEELHRTEHSIEFQVIYLQHALSMGTGALAAEPPRLVPILCSLPWQAYLQGEQNQALARQADGFLEALARELAAGGTDCLIVAGIDLAHVGRRFGDPGVLSDDFLARLQARDLTTLSLVAAGDRQGFVEEIIREQDDRRICGFAALYSLMRLLPGAAGRVVGYGQSVDRSAGSVVSYAGMVY